METTGATVEPAEDDWFATAKKRRDSKKRSPSVWEDVGEEPVQPETQQDVVPDWIQRNAERWARIRDKSF
jgi:hypothetical protein